jgi:hypothetical protein
MAAATNNLDSPFDGRIAPKNIETELGQVLKIQREPRVLKNWGTVRKNWTLRSSDL